MLLSLTHTASLVTAEESKKPLAILDNNQRKGSVNRFDKSLEEFLAIVIFFTTWLTLQLRIHTS